MSEHNIVILKPDKITKDEVIALENKINNEIVQETLAK